MRKCTQLASLLMTGLFIFSLSACNKESADTSVATPTASNSAQNDTAAQLYAELQKAATEGNLEQVRALIKRGANVNLLALDKTISEDVNDIEARYQETPLMLASKKGHLDVVKELLAAGANVNQILPVHTDRGMMPGEDQTALEMSCRPDNMAVVKALASAGADTQSVLICACLRGDEELLQIALQKKPNLNFTTGEGGVSPLIMAAGNGYTNIVKALLEAGADPNYTDPFDTDYTALRTAKDYPEIIELLKQAEANETKTQTANLPKQEEFDAALIEASRVGNYEEVKKLLAAGANVNITDGQETTPLWMASSNNHVQIVELLLGAGAKESIERASKRGYRGREDPQGTTPLWEASFRNHPEIVQLLLAAGARDAIYIASMRGDIEAVKFFIDEGVDVNEKDEMNDTALIWAAQRGYTEIVKLLLAAGADISVLEYRGDTPLIYAITEGHIEIVKLLLKAGADVNQRGFLLVTPLMRAAERGQEKVVKLLLQAGADVNKREDSGKTALQLAQEAGNEKIVKLLKQAGAKE